MLLSIIVPIYNADKYLEKCLDSIVNQTYKKIEIILVNDGSTDNSEKIVQEYQKKSNKIVYYKKENSGIADTRNFGISKATGNYLLFVDSDDYIDTDLIKNLSPYMNEKIDLIKFKLNRVNQNGDTLEEVKGAVFEETDGQTAFDKLYATDVLLDSPCVYLYRKNYITHNNFQFQVGTYHEDFGLIPLVVVKANSVVSLDYVGYYYIQSYNSITRNDDYNKTIQKMRDSLRQYDNMLKQIKKYNLRNKTEENVKIYYTNAIILKLNELKEKDKNIFIHEIKQRKMTSNIKIRNLKQFFKKIILCLSIKWYLKLR